MTTSNSTSAGESFYEFYGERFRPSGRNASVADVIKIVSDTEPADDDIEALIDLWHEDLVCVRQMNPIHTTVTTGPIDDEEFAQKYADKFDYEATKDKDGEWDLRNSSPKTLEPLHEYDWDDDGDDEVEWFDDDEVAERATRAFARSDGPSLVPSSVVFESDNGKIFVRLLNLQETLAVYRYFPESDRLRRLSVTSEAGAPGCVTIGFVDAAWLRSR